MRQEFSYTWSGAECVEQRAKFQRKRALHATEAFVGGRAASEVAMMMYRATNIWLLTEPLRTRASAFRHLIHGLKAVAIQGSADGSERWVRRTLSHY